MPASRGRRARRLGRPPGSDSALTRPRIVAAALERFAKDGYALATNSDIAQEAGLTTGAIYHYFASKQDLYAAVAEEVWEVLRSAFEAASENKRGFRAKIVAILDSSVALNRDNPALASFVITGPFEARRHPEIAGVISVGAERIRGLFQRLVDEAAENGEFAGVVRREDVTNMLLAVTVGLASFATSSTPAEHSAATAVLEQLLEGVLFSKGKVRLRGAAATG